MLVLTRKVGQELVLRTIDGHKVIVRIVSHRGDRVRIGVEADARIAVHRREVFEAIRSATTPQEAAR